MTFAGKHVTATQVKATVDMLRCYRRFLASDSERCRNLEERYGRDLDKDEARQRLAFLVNVAINRKAGIPDVACRKQEGDYLARLWRDCRGVRDAVNGICSPWGLNGRRWETGEIQARYGYLFDGPGEE